MWGQNIAFGARREPRVVWSRPAIAAVVLFAAMSVVLTVHAVKAGTPLRFYDERDYLAIAQSLSRGEGFAIGQVPTAVRPPAWPLLLAAFLLVGVPTSLLLAVPALLMVTGGVAAAYVGVRLSGSRWGAIAGLLVLAYPLNVYTAATLYPQAAATAILLVLWAIATHAADRGVRRLSAPMSAAIGLLIAALTLAVPTLIVTGLAIGAWFLWQQRGNRLRYLAVAGVCAAVPILAWGARNAVELDSPVLFSTTSGENLLVGNNPSASGGSGVTAGVPEAVEAAAPVSEVERDTYYRDVAIDWMSSHPGQAARLYVAKVANYFVPYNAPATESEGNTLQEVIAAASFLIIAAGAALRFLFRDRIPIRPTEWLFMAVFFGNAFAMAIFFTRPRFRQPLDNVLIVESAVALVVIATMVERRLVRRRRDRSAGVPTK